jgi:hypothetical protein
MPTTADFQAGIAQAVFVYPAMWRAMGTMHGGQGIAGLLQDGQAARARMGVAGGLMTEGDRDVA